MKYTDSDNLTVFKNPPTGAFYLDSDAGVIYRWSGTHWEYAYSTMSSDIIIDGNPNRGAFWKERAMIRKEENDSNFVWTGEGWGVYARPVDDGFRWHCPNCKSTDFAPHDIGRYDDEESGEYQKCNDCGAVFEEPIELKEITNADRPL